MTVLSRKPGGSGGGGAPSGPAGGSLGGTYPNPSIAAGAVDTTELANDAVESAQIANGAVGPTELAAGTVLFKSYAKLWKTVAQNTAGGTSSVGVNTIALAEAFDPDAIVTIAANQFTLQAGSYFITAWATAYIPNARHQVYIRNITDSTDDVIGASCYSQSTTTHTLNDRGTCQGRISPAAAKTYELRHDFQAGRATDGLGTAANFRAEVFAEVMIYMEQ